ncbi:protein Wnt-1 [Cloeon dipterum]|uniref:protein Wnt-1 n=1 Tax=Cloeon dipterum TaxID=197152 RepID=UPI00321F94A2
MWWSTPELLLPLLLLLLVSESEQVKKVGRARKGRGSNWWGIAKAGEPNNLVPNVPGSAKYDATILERVALRKKQARLIEENKGVDAVIVKGANMAINECQYQFNNRKWNCSTKTFLHGKNLFGKIVDRACRETAFIYAITSAGVAHAISRACSEGTIESCTCDYSHPRAAHGSFASNNAASNVVSPQGKDWVWGGCSDNIAFGFKFSREFVDTGERGSTQREKMNLHNNEAGRATVSAEMRRECKCHGMSGSCSIKTCWMRLPTFRAVGDRLKDRFDGASKVMVSNNGHNRKNQGPLNSNNQDLNNPQSRRRKSRNHERNNKYSSNSLSTAATGGEIVTKSGKYNFELKPVNPHHKTPGTTDLVYFESSPSFCDRNPKLGIAGTKGRRCNDTSMSVDGCDLMCCGRGYDTQEIVVTERCDCIFKWCCEVECKTCQRTKVIHTCK